MPWQLDNEMSTFYEFRRLSATLVFDLTDAFATDRGTRGPFPRPFEPIRFFATARIVGLNREEFKEPLELITKRNGSGYHIFHNMIKNADGTVIKRALADGQYELRVESSFYQPVNLPVVDVPRPTSAESLNLLPSYNYPFPLDLKPTGGRGFALLRGSLHTRNAEPVANANVAAVGANHDCTTDETGQWVLVFPDSFFPVNQTTANVTVVVTLATGPVLNVTNVDVEKGAERGLGETALRGWVLRGGIGVAGAIVEVQGHPDLTRTAADGSWFYYFGLDHSSNNPVDVTAVLPDGSTLTQNNQQVRPRATAIVPPFQFP